MDNSECDVENKVICSIGRSDFYYQDTEAKVLNQALIIGKYLGCWVCIHGVLAEEMKIVKNKQHKPNFKLYL